MVHFGLGAGGLSVGWLEQWLCETFADYVRSDARGCDASRRVSVCRCPWLV